MGGTVLLDDDNDGTSRVSFPELRLGAWFPTSALSEDDVVVGLRKVLVAPLDELKEAIDGHNALKWFDKLADVAEKEGSVILDDPSDETSQVKFPAPILINCWLPNSILTVVGESAKPEDDSEADDHEPTAETVVLTENPEQATAGGADDGDAAEGSEEQSAKRQRVE